MNEKGVYSYRTTHYPEPGKADAFGGDDYEYTDDAEYEARMRRPHVSARAYLMAQLTSSIKITL